MKSFDVVKENILNRRSIKPEKFNGKIIEDSIFNEIIELANWAPTHGFTEPWRFVVFKGDNRFKLAHFHATLYKTVNKKKDTYKVSKYEKTLNRVNNVSHILAIVMKRGSNPKIPELEEVASTAIAVQNIWLGAVSKGIACYWGSGGMTYHPEMKAFLGFNENDKVMGFFYMGYCDETLPSGKRLTPIEHKMK